MFLHVNSGQCLDTQQETIRVRQVLTGGNSQFGFSELPDIKI